MEAIYEGYFENDRFIPFGKARIPERRKVKVMVSDEVVPERNETKQATAWREFFEAVNANSEEMPPLERVNFMREVNL